MYFFPHTKFTVLHISYYIISYVLIMLKMGLAVFLDCFEYAYELELSAPVLGGFLVSPW